MKFKFQALFRALEDCTLLKDPSAPKFSSCRLNQQAYSKVQVLKQAAVEDLLFTQ